MKDTNNVRTLNRNGLTPEVVLHALSQEIHEYKEVYIVGVHKDGSPRTWASGDLNGISFASLILHDLALKQLNGNIITE